MTTPVKTWDAARYQSRHGYVSAYGEDLVSLLDPKAGERILDLGCGAGQLAGKISESGAEVMGLDRSPEMIAEAQRNFPSLTFEVADAANFQLAEKVDAVFSNAALHWVKDAEGAAGCVARALLPGGRFVLEMGGKGNIGAIVDAVRGIVGELETPWYFPSVGEYAAVLERHGFEVRLATLFDRPTRVEGEDGLEDWLLMFAGQITTAEVRREAARRLRPKLYHEGGWTLDYRRLRVAAIKK